MMKDRLVIIEDNYYHYFTIKQVLKVKCKLDPTVLCINDHKELSQTITELSPVDVLFCKHRNGIWGLLNLIERKKINRRNSNIVILLINNFNPSNLAKLLQSHSPKPSKFANAA